MKDLYYTILRKYNSVMFPLRCVYWKWKAFKNLTILPWDAVEIDKVVFATFEFFCEHNPRYFMKQAELELSSLKDFKEFDDFSRIEQAIIEKVTHLKHLDSIETYVTITRKINNHRIEELNELWGKSYKFPIITRIRAGMIEHEYYLKVDWHYINNELFYTAEKVHEDTKFYPSDIEDELNKIDIAYAREILLYKDYIWN